jgi:pyruvate-ferredoxin/flavodoxin oxidoreductase
MLQNRPNVKSVMLDTQVYSNTGGQNSDSTPMLGGNDMNVFGAASQGKNVEKKTVAETFLAGHGSPFVAQISIANAPRLYKSILDALEYRGTAFLQCFTTCQPEHGVPDDILTRDSVRHTRRPSTSKATLRSSWIGTRRSSSREMSLTATPSPTGARPRRASATI